MIKKLISIFSILLLSLVTNAQVNTESTPKTITVGVIPGGNPELLKTQSLELAKAIQGQLNIPINIYISKNYAGLVDAIKAGKVDFAFLTASTFVLAETQVPVKVLLKKVWKTPYYYSAIIVPKTSKIKKIQDLKGSKIAFVDQNSTSGYLYPKVALNKNKLKDSDFKEIVYSGNHQASIELLESHKVDAAAVFSDDDKGIHSAWNKFGKHKNKYKIIWLSSPIPNDPFIVRKDFYDLYPKATHSMMFTLIELLEQVTEPEKYSEILGSHDLMPATTKQYDPVREMVKALNIELKP